MFVQPPDSNHIYLPSKLPRNFSRFSEQTGPYEGLNMMSVQNPFLEAFLFYSEGGVAFSSGFGKSFACTFAR